MSENKTSHYLKYAIGEIILVVIGILIALSINNWNENRKNEIKANELTEKLKGEISEIVDYLEFTNNGIEHQVSYLRMVLNVGETNIDSILTKPRFNLSPIFYLTSYSQFFDPPSDIYETAINDGSILLLKDKALTRNLQSFNKSVKIRLDEIIEEEYKQSRKINDYISTNYAPLFNNGLISKENNWDKRTTKNLFQKLKNDGKIKFMLIERIALKKARQYFIIRYINLFENQLKKLSK